MRRIIPGDWTTHSEWHVGHGLPPPMSEVFPEDGLIEDGLAMGFVYIAGPVAFMDLFVTNPKAPRIARSRALRRVAEGLEFVAKGKGCRMVWATTERHGIGAMARSLGWKNVGKFDVWMSGL